MSCTYSGTGSVHAVPGKCWKLPNVPEIPLSAVTLIPDCAVYMSLPIDAIDLWNLAVLLLICNCFVHSVQVNN